MDIQTDRFKNGTVSYRTTDKETDSNKYRDTDWEIDSQRRKDRYKLTWTARGKQTH